MTRAKNLLERIYRERDFFGGIDKRITQAAAEDAEDFADYEAAVEALETLLMSFGNADGGSVFVNVHEDGIFDFPKDVYAARAALARLREGEPANV